MESPYGRGVVEFAATGKAICAINLEDLYDAVERYAAHDWGDVSPEVRRQNEVALRDGGTLYSEYTDSRGVKFYITSKANERMPRVSLTKDSP